MEAMIFFYLSASGDLLNVQIIYNFFQPDFADIVVPAVAMGIISVIN